ncbi:MAG TPA: RecX family transcriptional regulator [Gaiellaceae bacterium]|nr:RecX family transcriptional regulator [Gaiellaceae bacterium]
MSYDAALESALRALSHRDRSSAQLEQYLADRGFGEEERRAALEALARTAVVDDERYADNRACALGGRGAGDASIRQDLSTAGVTDEEIEHALAGLEPERQRAERIVARRGSSAKTARYLTGKGFSEDVVRSVVAQGVGETLG